MVEKVLNRLIWFFRLGARFPFKNVLFKGSRDAIVEIGENVTIRNSTIEFSKNAKLTIAKNCIIENINMNVDGVVFIGQGTKLLSSQKNNRANIFVNGSFICGDNNRLQTDIKVRFGGHLKLQDCNNINTGSEIRCDESITIGSYNRISYDVKIWDTNTHNIYDAQRRRELNQEIGMGNEFEKPKTNPILIGDDCWIAKDTALLKGVKISDKCIIGYHTVLSNILIEENTTVVNDFKYKMFKNNM